MFTVPDLGGDISEGAAAGAADGFLETGLVSIGCHDDAFAAHERGEVEGFAACAGAGVPPAFAGIGVADQRDGLGGEILNFKLAAEKCGEVVNVGIGFEPG